MKKQRSSLSLHPPIQQKAKVLMKLRDFPTLTGFIEQLVREEWDRHADREALVNTMSEMLLHKNGKQALEPRLPGID